MSEKNKTPKGKKAKAPRKAKDASKKGAGKRTQLAGDTRLVWAKKENPFREGTSRAVALDAFKGATGNTVDGFLKKLSSKGFGRSYVSWMVREGLLKTK